MKSAVQLIKCAIVSIAIIPIASGHDTWVQTNTNIVRVGDVAYVDLMLGNHGNDHRDFKVAGKVSIEECKLSVIDPDGKASDLKSSLIDQGLAPKEGYWTARVQTAKAGLYLIAESSDNVVSYAPKRSVKSAKTFILASKSLDRPPSDSTGFDRVLGHALEIVPTTNPVAPMGPGTAIGVKLLFKGKPLANTRVSFIPRGETLKEGSDDRYERNTDANGIATFEPKDANLYLVVAHRDEDKESGQGYESIKYSATLTVLVPAICACCGE